MGKLPSPRCLLILGWEGGVNSELMGNPFTGSTENDIPCRDDLNGILYAFPYMRELHKELAQQVKNLPAGDTGDLGSISGSGSSPGEGNDNPLQYSCLEDAMDRRAWWATAHGVEKCQTGLIN